MAKTKIPWTDWTWNPVTGCTKLGSGCKNCYAEGNALGLQSEGMHKYRNGFEVTTHEYALKLPYTIPNPSKIMVESMGDLWHKDVPFEFIKKAYSVMNSTPQHAYLDLTKRPERVELEGPSLNWTDNIWLGVSIESPDYLDRIDHLLRTGAQHRFLSLEPLLEPLPDLCLDGIDWVIVGCESGPNRRRMNDDWVRQILDKCQAAQVPFFYKQQYIGYRKVELPTLDGKVWAEFPSGLVLPKAVAV